MALNINFAKGKGFNCPLPAPAFAPIGSVGTAGQMAAGHVLEQASFPTSAFAGTSFYNLTSTSTAGDGNTSLGHTLTNNGTALFTGTGIFGLANSCMTLNGSSQYLSSTDIHFDPGSNDFCMGCWLNKTSWADSTARILFNQWESGKVFRVYFDTNNALYGLVTSDGSTAQTMFSYSTASLTSWHHIAVKHTASSKTLSLYVDGRLVTSGVYTGSLYSAGGTRNFKLGSDGTYFISGSIDEFFFCNGTAFTDNDIAKIYARKYSHGQNIAPVSQKWIFQGQSGGQTRELLDNIVDMQANDLYYDLSDEVSTTQVSLRLANIY